MLIPHVVNGCRCPSGGRWVYADTCRLRANCGWSGHLQVDHQPRIALGALTWSILPQLDRRGEPVNEGWTRLHSLESWWRVHNARLSKLQA